MKRLFLPATALLAVCMLLAQAPPDAATPEPTRLPNGKLQTDEIVREEHEKSIKDAAQLVDLAESLKAEIEKDDAHVLSIASLKKTEEIEKIARRIRSRMKHY